MPETEKAKVRSKENKANPDHDGPELLIWHDAFSYKTKQGKVVKVAAHWEVNPQLSASRKAEARKLKAEKQRQPAPARKAKRGRNDAAAPSAAEAEADA